MIFIIVSIIAPILIYLFTPLALNKITKKNPKQNTILMIACLIFFISWYLPSPLIEGENTQFTTHFVGGGIFTGFLWWYITKNTNLRLHWFTSLVFLYFLVSALGVANELFELAVAKSGIEPIALTDTSWDLFANTIGALTFWFVYQICLLYKQSKH